MIFEIGNLEELLSQLTCVKCHKLLSVFPIHTIDGISTCGRCKDLIEGIPSTNTAYEALAKHVIFPCANKAYGCTANLKQTDVENHEKLCKYRSLACPFNVVDAFDRALECDWTNSITNLPSHLRDSHSSMLVSNPHTFTLNSEESNVKVNFMDIDPETAFIVFSKHDKDTNKFYCMAMCGDDEPSHKKYAYQLELGKEDNYFFHLRKDHTELLCDTSKPLANLDKMIMVDVASAANLFGNLVCNLQCRISIIKMQDSNPKVEPVGMPGTSTAKETALDHATTKPNEEAPRLNAVNQALLESNKLTLQELECLICCNYMTPPIYICSQGHSLCKECKSRTLACPTCRISMGNTHNYALENLTQKVLYSCEYSPNGCPEVLPISQIVTHQASCIRKTNCPIGMIPPCNFMDCIVDPVAHIYEQHANILVTENTVFKRDIKSLVNTSYFVTIVNNEIFIMCCSSTHRGHRRQFKFNFLHVGMKSNQPQYRYRLTFIDQSQMEMNFSINQLCQEVPSDINNSLKDCLEIPLQMLKPYILSNRHALYYQFNIEKI